jgi:hypothetical protein
VTPPAIFFVHVMKTAGTTLVRHLRENYALDEIYPYRPLDIRVEADVVDVRYHLSVPYLLALSPERRSRIRIYTGHFPYVASELLQPDITRITVLRDPVERTISLLRQFRRKATWLDASDREPMLASRTLEEVYEHPLVFAPLVQNHQTKVFSLQESDRPENYMHVIDVDEARLAIARANLAKIDVLGLTERYDEFLDECRARFGWQIVRGARKNVTPPEDVDPVPQSLRRRIAADNALDMELYAYATELVELRGGRRAVDA